VAAGIFEPVQGIAGACDLSADFVTALRNATQACGALLIADEVQCGMGRCGQFFAVQIYNIEPDLLTTAKALGGGVPCAALLASETLAMQQKTGALGTTFGGGPLAAAAIVAVIDTLRSENLLDNVREREAQIRQCCVTGPVTVISGKGLLLGLKCDRPAREVQSALLECDILAGTSTDPNVLRLLPPLVLQAEHVERLASALGEIAPRS
jgi:acetylornithine/N-succinyldiaminopimelate aminotransferase